jgi:geranyl-CoA carboxylase alpha subunit
MNPIRKVLIANRGEIACRIMRTAKARGIRTVAVYSDADAKALHVRTADEAARLGGSAPAESYLNIAKIINAAQASRADAIHPGYGFLSERADFAQACADAGVIFIGPPASAIAAMGDKAEAKRRMIAAGVPTAPGYQDEDQSDARFAKEAERIGFPVMVKASAGGGGRGMRLVADKKELKSAIASARNEAENAFGDGRLLLEKAIVGARHVEIQVMADKHGNVVHLGERDCSLQRRRQKVIEEAPSPVISDETRAKMGAAAVEAARAVGYVNAGTVEFLYDPKTKQFYFLEMNTRLQVEHPVTECVTGLDLVALQFDIAEGGKLPVVQKDVSLNGAAIEARLYAEDPSRGFLPQTGRISLFAFPEGVRVDAGVATGDEVSAFYDPMIAKVIAYGKTRNEARLKLAAALERATLLGLTTNAPFLISLLRDETFAKSEADTNYIEANLERLAPKAPPVTPLEVTLAAFALSNAPHGGLLTGWNSRGDVGFPLKLSCGDESISARAFIGRDWAKAEFNGETICIDIREGTETHIRYRLGDLVVNVPCVRAGDTVDLHVRGTARRFIDMTYAPAAEHGAGADRVKAPMAGVVTGVTVKRGDAVKKGDILATMEAMKMEHRLAAPRDGVVRDVAVKTGDQIAVRALVLALEPAGAI